MMVQIKQWPSVLRSSDARCNNDSCRQSGRAEGAKNQRSSGLGCHTEKTLETDNGPNQSFGLETSNETNQPFGRLVCTSTGQSPFTNNGAKSRNRGSDGMGNTSIRIGTVNVRGIKGKEVELAKEIEKFNLNIVGISETKKCMSGESDLNGNYSMVHSGVKQGHAYAGVALAYDKTMSARLIKWEAVHERILWALFKLDEVELKIVVVYGPVEGSSSEESDDFFEDLDRVVKTNHKEKVIILGDFNSRVGSDNQGIEHIMGKFGEKCLANSNGKKLIDLCLGNEFIITNTIFRHKDIHKFTWREEARNRHSIIDYILVDKSLRNAVIDTRVFRGFEIGSDHYLVASSLKLRCKPLKKSSNSLSRIRIDKLKDAEVKRDFQRQISQEYVQIETSPCSSLEEEWERYKNCLIGAAKRSCGMVVCKDRKIRTPWWTPEVSRAVKDKKRAYRKFLSNKTQSNLEAYRSECQRAKMCVRAAKAKSWEEFGHHVEENFHNGQKLFWSLVKRLRSGRKTVAQGVTDKNGNLLTSLEDMLSRWNEYFRELLNVEQESGNQVSRGIGSNESDEDWMTIGIHEVRDAIASLKVGKAAGVDEIRPEMVKYSGITGIWWLYRIIKLAWETGCVPGDWQKSIIVPIYKKGNKKDCSNYRGISLLSVPGKVYTSILSKKLGRIVEGQLGEEQCGFRSARGCQDNIFVIRQLCEKFYEVNQDLHMVFVDFEKAFDRVPRNSLFSVLETYGVKGKLLNSIESLYSRSLSAVRIEGGTSKWFEVNCGVRQGCKLSPLLFLIYMDKIVKESNFISDVELNGFRVSCLLYADDLVLICRSVHNLQHNLHQLQAVCREFGMKINEGKTKSLVVGRQTKSIDCEVQGKVLEQVSDFNYLGVVISDSGRIDREIDNRICRAGKVTGQLFKTIFSKKEVSKRAKLAVYNAVFRPTLYYGAESWVRNKSLVKRLEVADMRVLRGISGKNRWTQWQDRISNADIRAELGTLPVQDKVDENILRWFGHVSRMGEERIPKKVLYAKVAGRRPRGRPRMRWLDGLKLAISSRGYEFERAKELTRDRKRWRKFVLRNF